MAIRIIAGNPISMKKYKSLVTSVIAAKPDAIAIVCTALIPSEPSIKLKKFVKVTINKNANN